ncbi:pyridoxal phosphate-dependent transferase [Chaetomium tenue]|uniref:Pyridoxal phosphate-dependent transferase n=1 Tax=Chaetomium tenue TaxID=1854479 RepID=A0ACB7P5K0_9PEZI|nr:pyridoxal phosphate-dependent transferase [Chaetomium globosum]
MPTISEKYPEYQATARLDELRATEYSYLDSQDHVYLDYTGSGLAASAQIRHHHERLSQNLYGNPHSSNPTSAAATEAMNRTRARILAHLNASPDEYTVIFTANATGAARLVGEAYPFSKNTRLVLTADNHNSVNGLREFARARGAPTTYIPLQQPSLRTSTSDTKPPPSPPSLSPSSTTKSITQSPPHSPSPPPSRSSTHHKPPLGLLAYPAQSNFTGVRHPLTWIRLAHQRGYHVLLDAAAYLPTSTLDLSSRDCQPDFVILSWYKVFGFPTGVGCLVARRDALGMLRANRPWFAGGTVQAAMVGAGAEWHVLAGGAEGFEDGTGNFLGVPDVVFGLDWLMGGRVGGVGVVGERVRCLTGWFLERLGGLRHADGRAMVRVYGPRDMVMRGGTVAFNFLDAEGKVVDERIVAMESAAARISLRTGCFCNPGAGEAAFELDFKGVRKLSITRKLARSRQASGGLDQFIDALGMPYLGAIRVSFGLASNVADVDKFFGFAEKTYKDRVITELGLPPRIQC